MTTLGLTNFGSLTAPIQPLSDFDNILGNQSSPTQGAGLLGYTQGIYGSDPGSVGYAIDSLAVPIAPGIGLVVVNIAALRALLKTGIGRAYVLGYYAMGDRGGGQYYYDPTDTTSADNGGSIIVATDGGRWKLEILTSVSVRQFGAKGDGTTDDTTALQAAITYARLQAGVQIGLLWNTGTYKTTTQLTWGSSQSIDFEPGVTINGVQDVNTPLFAASNQTGVYVRFNGAVLNGNRAGVTLSDTGNQTAIYLFGCRNYCIQDANINNFGFDGITITGDTGSSGPCKNGRLLNNFVNNCGRNALSVIHTDGLIVYGGSLQNSNGTPSGPWAGFDVEPNSGGQYAKGVRFIGVRTQGNNGPGRQFTPGAMSTMTGLTFDVEDIGGYSLSDGAVSSGSSGTPALSLTSGGTYTNEVGGQVTVRDLIIESPGAMGWALRNWDAVNAPRALLDNVLVINPNGAGASTGNPNQSGGVVNCDTTQSITNMGKLTVKNCKSEDNRASPKMVWPFIISAFTGKTVQNVSFQDCDGVNYTATIKAPVSTDLASGGSFTDVSVIYTNPRKVNSSTSQALSAWGGQQVNFTATTLTATLPLAALCKGSERLVSNDPTSGGNCTVAISGSDTIKAPGVAAASSYTLAPGDSVKLRSNGGTSWTLAPNC